MADEQYTAVATSLRRARVETRIVADLREDNGQISIGELRIEGFADVLRTLLTQFLEAFSGCNVAGAAVSQFTIFDSSPITYAQNPLPSLRDIEPQRRSCHLKDSGFGRRFAMFSVISLPCTQE